MEADKGRRRTVPPARKPPKPLAQPWKTTADVPEDKRIQFRIGINVGDIIVEGDDIHGGGVNVAARLESLAKPGSICISRRVHEDVSDKLDPRFEDLGEQTLKNITKPIEVYRVLLEPEAAGTLIAAKTPRNTRWRWLSAAAAVLIIVIGGGAIWNFAIRDDRVKVEAASVERMAFPLRSTGTWQFTDLKVTSH